MALAALQMIRMSEDYGLVVVAGIIIQEDDSDGVKVSPTDKYYVYNRHAGQNFACVSETEALSYFSGMAGMGFGGIPLRAFKTLTKIELWRRQSQEAWAREQLALKATAPSSESPTSRRFLPRKLAGLTLAKSYP